MKKKQHLTGRQIKFIINLISFAIFAFSYLYIYSHYVNETEAAHKTRDQIKQEITQREKLLAEEELVRENTDQIKEQSLTITSAYPVFIAKEDNFIFIEKLQKDLGVQFTSMSVGDSGVVVDTGLAARAGEDIQDEVTGTEADQDEGESKEQETMKGMQTSISFSFNTTMNSFKKFVDYIKGYPEQTSIESAAVSYDSSTGNLSCNVVIKRFYLTGTGKAYEPPYINDISIGTDNIFGVTPKIETPVIEEQLTTP